MEERKEGSREGAEGEGREEGEEGREQKWESE